MSFVPHADDVGDVDIVIPCRLFGVPFFFVSVVVGFVIAINSSHLFVVCFWIPVSIKVKFSEGCIYEISLIDQGAPIIEVK